MRFALIFILALPLTAQHLNLGAIGGVNLTGDIRDGTQTYPGGILPSGQPQTSTYFYESPSRQPIIGLKLEFEFGRRWALELDAMRREIRSRQRSTFSPPLRFPDGMEIREFPTITRTLSSWEFPVLMKYRLGSGSDRFRPVLMAGPSFRPAGSGTNLSHAGVSAGLGMDIKAGGFRIEPQVRYTRWLPPLGGSRIGTPGLNQVEFLVGFDRPPSDGAPVTVFGRRLSFGFIAGVALGDDFRVGSLIQGQQPEANSALYGIALEAPVAGRWAIEVDGLYRPLHGTSLEFGRPVRFAHLTWEFPVLAKYRIGSMRRFQPFLEGGPSFRAEGNLNLRPASHYGATFGGGIETRLSRLKIAPMFRYTRWKDDSENRFASQTKASQSQLLISFSF